MLRSLIVLLCLLPAALSAQTADPEPTRVLVLATPHLAEMEQPPGAAALEPLIARLAGFRPSVIAVELLPPAVLEDMERRGGFFAQVAAQFGGLRLRQGKQQQERLGLTRREAEEAAAAILNPPGSLEPAARLRLVPLLVAALDWNSAVLQWSYLDLARRQAGGLPAELAAALDRALAAPREDISVAVPLARRLGLERLAYMDDHFDAQVFADIMARHPAELKKLAQHPLMQSEARRRFYEESGRRLRQAAGDGQALLRHYQWVNSPEFLRRDEDFQWGTLRRTALDSGVDRARLAQWEARNLRMAAHVRQASALHPGGRVLVLVGSAHKPFLDRYLEPMTDVQLVQFSALAE